MNQSTAQQLSLEDWVEGQKATERPLRAAPTQDCQENDNQQTVLKRLRIKGRSHVSGGFPFTKEQLLSRCQINPVTTCWVWQGALDVSGYGQVSEQGRSGRAHRVSYRLHKGVIPDGMCVLHNCPGGDNPACCNPDHLWLGTRKDNNADKANKNRTVVQRKVTDKMAEEIRSDPRGYRKLAKAYGLARSTIQKLKRGYKYKYPERTK